MMLLMKSTDSIVWLGRAIFDFLNYWKRSKVRIWFSPKFFLSRLVQSSWVYYPSISRIYFIHCLMNHVNSWHGSSSNEGNISWKLMCSRLTTTVVILTKKLWWESNSDLWPLSIGFLPPPKMDEMHFQLS